MLSSYQYLRVLEERSMVAVNLDRIYLGLYHSSILHNKKFDREYISIEFYYRPNNSVKHMKAVII